MNFNYLAENWEFSLWIHQMVSQMLKKQFSILKLKFWEPCKPKVMLQRLVLWILTIQVRILWILLLQSTTFFHKCSNIKYHFENWYSKNFKSQKWNLTGWFFIFLLFKHEIQSCFPKFLNEVYQCYILKIKI